MKTLLLTLFPLAALAQTIPVDFNQTDGLLASGKTLECIIAVDGLYCWRRHRYAHEYPSPPPYEPHEFYWGKPFPLSVKEPRQVAIGGSEVCVLGVNGVECWLISDPQNAQPKKAPNTPPLRNPRQVAAGGSHICAIDDEGLKCWGNNDEGQLEIPPLKNPKFVQVSGAHTCALDDEGIHCWGSYDYSRRGKEPPYFFPLRGIEKFSMGFGGPCALSGKELVCARKKEISERFSVKNPRYMNAGINGIFVVDDDGYKFWNDWSSKVLSFSEPMAFAQGNYYYGEFMVAELSAGGIIYPFSKDEKMKPVPLDIWQTLKSTSSGARMEYFNHLLEFRNKNFGPREIYYLATENPEHYLLASLAGAAVRTTQSPYYLEKMIGGYEDFLTRSERKLGISGRLDVKDSLTARKAALQSLLSAYLVGKEFVPETERSEIATAIRLLGAAMNRPQNKEISTVLRLIRSMANTRKSLAANERTVFLVTVIDDSLAWLHGKVRE